MRVYIAAPYASRDDEARICRRALRDHGFEVTASWMDDSVPISNGTTGAANSVTLDEVQAGARLDLEEVSAADAVVLLTNETAAVDSTSGGRHVESGYALACGVQLVVVGDAENVFHRLPEVITVPDDGYAESLLTALDALRATQALAKAARPAVTR